MQVSPNPNRIIRFGVFEVDLQQAELRHSGLRQKLSPQAFEVLRVIVHGKLIKSCRDRSLVQPSTVPLPPVQTEIYG